MRRDLGEGKGLAMTVESVRQYVAADRREDAVPSERRRLDTMLQIRIACMMVGLGCLAIAQGDEIDQIIVADELRTAFYEAAPAKIAKSMRAAVVTACAEHDVTGWMCNGQSLSFLRGVYVNGFKQTKGYVCEGMSDVKHLPPDLVEGNETENCVAVSYDEDSKRHYIDSVDFRGK